MKLGPGGLKKLEREKMGRQTVHFLQGIQTLRAGTQPLLRVMSVKHTVVSEPSWTSVTEQVRFYLAVPFSWAAVGFFPTLLYIRHPFCSSCSPY